MTHTKSKPEENRMGTVPIPRLMITMGAPMMLSMFVQALYNIVDSLYVSHIPDTAGIINAGDKAVAALTLAFPVQMLITSLCVGTGVGVNASLSKSLGQGNRQRASRIAGNAVVLSILYYFLVAAFGLFATEAYIRSQTDNSVTFAFGCSYLRIVTVFSLGMTLYLCFEKLLQSTGQTTAAMIGQLVGSITNIILDPILIFGWLGLPAMGVSGAAIATVAGQFVSCIATIILHIRKNKELDKRVSMMKPDTAIIGRIYAVGAPAIAMQALGSVMSYGMNLILSSISEAAITAYGIFFKLQSFIFMPAFGLNNASVPIIAYNYGAQRKKRIRDAILIGIVICCSIMVIGVLILQLLCRQIVGLFAVSDAVAQLSVTALRIITCGFLFAGANIILSGACQALGNGIYSLLISILRMIIIVLPVAWLLSRLPDAEHRVWLAFPISEFAALIASVILASHLYRSRTRTMNTIQDPGGKTE